MLSVIVPDIEKLVNEVAFLKIAFPDPFSSDTSTFSMLDAP